MMRAEVRDATLHGSCHFHAMIIRDYDNSQVAATKYYAGRHASTLAFTTA
jgi:hypothetical protein